MGEAFGETVTVYNYVLVRISPAINNFLEDFLDVTDLKTSTIGAESSKWT